MTNVLLGRQKGSEVRKGFSPEGGGDEEKKGDSMPTSVVFFCRMDTVKNGKESRGAWQAWGDGEQEDIRVLRGCLPRGAVTRLRRRRDG